MRNKLPFFILASIGLVLYLPSLFGPFLWDDEDFVYANQYVKEFRIDKFFTDSQTAGRGKLSNYYRPLPQIVYATTHSLFGPKPPFFHAVNILVHIGAASAIFIFLRLMLTGKAPPGISLLVALIFLIHPVQTEAVSYISGLSDPLYVLFGTLALITFSLRNKRHNMLILSLGFFVLSLLSKETALVFLPLTLLLEWTISHKIRHSLYFALPAGLYLLYHFTAINNLDIAAAWGQTAYTQSVTTRFLTFISNWYSYLLLLVFPWHLFMERDYSVAIQTNWLSIQSLGFLLINGALIYWLSSKRDAQLWFCYLAFYISFIPYTGIVLINGLFYEHFLYLPLVFFFAFWLLVFKDHLRPVLPLLAVGLFLLATRNIIRQFDWNDEVRFYTQTLHYAPKSIRIRNGLGMAYAKWGNYEKSLQIYAEAIKLSPQTPNLYHNSANVYLATGEVDKAEEFFRRALTVDPNFFFSWQALASLYEQTGQKEKLDLLLREYQKGPLN